MIASLATAIVKVTRYATTINNNQSIVICNYSGCIKLDRHLPYSDGSLIAWRYAAPRKVPVKLLRG
jgi:hypothetical protein